MFEPRTAHKRKALLVGAFLVDRPLQRVAHARVWNALWNTERSAGVATP